jgi:rfaE bifunctional protein kinase chain/domain
MAEVNKLTQVFNDFSKMNILIIGDVMIDAYLWGEVTRISPEAPVPIVSKTTHENRLGGAGNVALNIQSLGANPILCAVIGNDEKSKTFLELLNDNALSSEGIIRSNERITTVKTRIISQNHHLLRIDEEDSSPISKNLEHELLHNIRHILTLYKIDAIIFEDYDKGVITPTVISEIVVEAKKLSIPTLVDPKKRNFTDYKGVSFFKPNFKEFKEGLKIEIDKGDQAKLLSEAKAFLQSSDNKCIMITLAEHGVFICKPDSHSFFPAQIRNIADVSGAGDTVISVSALCMAAKLPENEVAQIANMAGGLVCEKPGVVPIDKSLLLEECLKKIPEYANR